MARTNWLNLNFKIRQAQLDLRAQQLKDMLGQTSEQIDRLNKAYDELLEILRELEEAEAGGPN